MKRKLAIFIILCLALIPIAPKAAGGIDILSPLPGAAVGSGTVTLEVSADTGLEKISFYIDGTLFKTFDGGEASYSAVYDDASYGLHNFKAVGIKKGAEAAVAESEFSVVDTTEKQFLSIDFNIMSSDLSGSGIGWITNNNAVFLAEKREDEVQCLKILATNANNTDLYLPFFNFTLPDTTGIVTLEFEALVSNEGIRLRYESGDVFDIFRYSKCGDTTLEPLSWNHIKVILNYSNRKCEIYINGSDEPAYSEELSKASTGSAPRFAFADAYTNSGYLLIDNIKYSSVYETPMFQYMIVKANGSSSQIKNGVIPSGAEQIKMYFKGTYNQGTYKVSLIENGNEIACESSVNTDSGIVTIKKFNKLKDGSNIKAVIENTETGKKIEVLLKTENTGLYVKEHSFSNGSYNIIDLLQLNPGEKVFSKVNVVNGTDEEKSILCIQCVYENGVMKNIVYTEKTVSANSSAEIETPSGESAGDEIICYIIDSWAERVPIAVAGYLKD